MKKSTRLQVQSSCTFYLVEVRHVLYQVEVLHLMYSPTLSVEARDVAMQFEVGSLGPQVF